jgi:EAL domain-containing protein (putative c-di-GMP-specific phosphodiesterase class I)
MKIDPAMIEFEITETLLIEDISVAAQQMRTLKRAGFQIALDDFGSGYAGFGYLSQIPFDTLKIDRSFVQDLGSKAGAGGVVQSIIGLARAMGLAVTAEGVEDQTQQELLQAGGCSQMQGFLFYKPMSATEILKLRQLPRGEVRHIA